MKIKNKLHVVTLMSIGVLALTLLGQVHFLDKTLQQESILRAPAKPANVTKKNVDRYLMYHHRADCIHENVFGERYIGWIAAQADSSKATIYFQCLYEPITNEGGSHVEGRRTKG